jgi:hypothetical protein
MFCPKCAAHNIEDAKYCRVCGADISLVPQVLSGQLGKELASSDEPAVEKGGRRRKRKSKDEDKPPTYEKAFENIGVGLAFLIISLVVGLMMPGGRFWGFWLLIPALACVGEGVGQLVRLKREKDSGAGRQPLLREPQAVNVATLPPHDESRLTMMPPPSITEHTTRHLRVETPSRESDDQAERPPRSLD